MERRHRLAQRGQFERIRREGRTWAQPLLVLVALSNHLPYNRFGFLVSRRIGKAVVRNRVKRLMREAMRERLAAVSPGWDVVLIARAAIVEADLWRIGEALDSLLLRAGLMAEAPKALDVSK